LSEAFTGLKPVIVAYEWGTARPIPILVNHTGIFTIQGGGKSVLSQTMIREVTKNNPDLRVLVFDNKEEPDYAGIGTDIPVYMADRYDTLSLMFILQQSSKIWLGRHVPELDDLINSVKTPTLENIFDRNEEMIAEKHHPIVIHRLKDIRVALRKLKDEYKRVPFETQLSLPSRPGIYRMPLNPYSDTIKGIAMDSTIRWILEHEHDVIIVVDEAKIASPQDKQSPCKESMAMIVERGRAKTLFLWAITQTITGMDKKPLKQVYLWVIGRQREVNEIKRAREQCIETAKITKKELMTLPTGVFFVNLEEETVKVYVRPWTISEEDAKQVALGKLPITKIAEKMRKIQEALVPEWQYCQVQRSIGGKCGRLRPCPDHDHTGVPVTFPEAATKLSGDIELPAIVLKGKVNVSGQVPVRVREPRIHDRVREPILSSRAVSDLELRGRILYLAAIGRLDEKVSSPQVGAALSEVGAWIHATKEIDLEMNALCDLKFFTRRRTDRWWYMLTGNAKQRIILEKVNET
jgi:hypothetical protein